MSSLRPYRPTSRRPWNRAVASRFLRRVGFAPSRAEVEVALERGPAATVKHLVRDATDGERYDEIDQLGSAVAIRSPRESTPLASWWLHRMAHTERPLRERMLVFWHDHFATSHAKVRNSSLMLNQLRTIERHAFGRFEDLLLAMSRDAAMILWLDGDQNVKGRPNENFARELLELFSLGVGNYTELDIREAARAFTGWHQKNGKFRYVARNHDSGEKTVLGATGPLDGDDVVRIVAAHPACSRFLARKLCEEFVTAAPPAGLTASVAEQLRRTGFDIRATLEVLLASEAMFDPELAGSRVKSPVEWVVGLVRSLELRASSAALSRWTSRMGQRLFEPPSVEGWEGHRAWLDSATMLVRLNAALDAIAARDAGEVVFRPGALRNAYELFERDEVLDYCESITLDGEVPDAISRRIRGGDAAGREDAEADGRDLDGFMRNALRLLLASPEYQLV